MRHSGKEARPSYSIRVRTSRLIVRSCLLDEQRPAWEAREVVSETLSGLGRGPAQGLRRRSRVAPMRRRVVEVRAIAGRVGLATPVALLLVIS